MTQKKLVVVSLSLCLLATFTVGVFMIGNLNDCGCMAPMALLKVESSMPSLQMGDVGEIYSLQVYQWTGSSWVFRGSAGASGGTITLVAEQPVHFDVVIVVDYYTVSPVSCAGAMGDTRVYLAIAGEVSSTLMTVDSCPSNIPDVVWYVLFTYDWDVAAKPAAGATYTLTLTYQAYY